MAEYFFGITDKGKRREKNEDSFLVGELSNKQFLVACVIDGVGGYNGGEIAAAIARSVILERLGDISGDVNKMLHEAIDAANTKIRDEKKKDSVNQQMACVLTCVITDIKNNKFYYAHVGDTRLYLWRDKSLVKLSKDHSVVGFLEESGRLSEEEAMRHPRRNEINKALGFEEYIGSVKDFIETGESPFLPGDVLLLCSDGLSDMISSNTITSILNKNNDLGETAGQLIAAANDAGGDDNITAVLVQNNNQPGSRVVLKPAKANKPALHAIKSLPGETIVPQKNKTNITAFISLLILCVLAVLLFQKNTGLHNDRIKYKAVYPKAAPVIPRILPTVIPDTGKTYSIGQALFQLADTITINRDSFHLFGNGVTIVCDSNYKGPAIVIGNNSKQVILDSIVFKNFNTGIIVQKNNLQLKNVRFINCSVPVQYQLSFNEVLVNGRLKDSIFITETGLEKKPGKRPGR